MRREYQTGSKYALWRWKDIYWRGELYLRRLILVQCPLFSVMIHFINSPDKQEHQHDHPVSMLSIVLKGWYVEQTGEHVYDLTGYPRRVETGAVCIDWFNWIPASKRHRIDLIDPNGVITLCLAGPRTREWGFYTEQGWIHWQKYHEQSGGSTT